MKKSNFKKILSAILAALMLVSAFAILPAGAENIDLADNGAKDGDLLWSLDFDGYSEYQTKNPGATVTQYLKSEGLNANGFIGVINDAGKLVNDRRVWHHDAGENDPFHDLIYGIYKDENGNAVTEYYLELDYTLITPGEGRAYSFTGTDADGKTVTYTIYSPYRGESYFNPMAGGGYDIYLFKISSSGYLYTPANAKTQTFKTADGGNANINYFTYTKKVDNTVVATKQPVTREIWELMREECGTDKASGTVQTETFDRVHSSGSNFYQMQVGKEYTIRVKMSVGANGKVTATTYVKPVDSDEPFARVGSTSYTFNGDRKAQSIRFSENTHKYTLDNMKIVKGDFCEGEHDFPVIEKKVANGSTVDNYTKLSCQKCGAVYYEDCGTDRVLQSFDFTKKSDYDSFMTGPTYKAKSGTISFSEGNGMVFNQPATVTGSAQVGPELTYNLPIKDPNGTYKTTFTATINDLPCNQTGNIGSSFFTDRTGNTFTIMLRMGRNSDYDPSRNDNEGWLKLMTVNKSVDWKNIKSAYTIKEGETYKFTLVMRPAEGLFDLYINDDFVATGGMNAAKWNGSDTPYFRLANQMEMGMVLKDYSFAVVEEKSDYTIYNGSNTAAVFNMGSVIPKLDADGNMVLANVASTTTNSSSTIYLEDNHLEFAKNPFNVSFDFKMTDNGEFKDDASPDSALWSLISWIATSGGVDNYNTMVRVGGIDSDETKNGFERFFMVMTNNGGYTDSADNGNQGYTGTVGGEISGYYSDKNSLFTFGANEWVTVTLSVNPFTSSAYLYVNGELVGSASGSAYSKKYASILDITKSRLRIGDSFRKLHYNWAIKNIEVESTPGVVAEVKDTNTIFNMDFGKPLVGNAGNNTNLGNIILNVQATSKQVKDTATTEGYTTFFSNAAACSTGSTLLYNLSLTSTVGDGVYYNHVEGKKYAIETEFALHDRVPTDEEKASVDAYNTANGTSLKLPDTFSEKEAAIIRLSKYHDNNRITLINHNKTSLVAISSTKLPLYTKDESGKLVLANAWYTDADLVDGKIPESAWMKVRTVIDERNDTFSVYINDSIAYYKDGDSFKRAENLKMDLVIGTNSFASLYPDAPEMAEFNRSGLYKDLPRTVTVNGETKAYNFQKLENICYVRFFQNTFEYSVRNLSVTKIDDGLNFVGAQRRDESDTAGAYDLRFVFATDDIYFDSIEYDVTVDAAGGTGNIKTAESNTVYRSIKSTVGDVNAWKYDGGEYFSVFNVDGVEIANESDVYTFRVTPYKVRYNVATGESERDVANATLTHVIKFNGKGELIGYSTESAEWANVAVKYTDISAVPYKSLGRTQMLDGALTADWSAAGIEFEATCVGEVSIKVTTDVTRNFTIVIDGVEQKNFKMANGNNVIASGLPYGKHSFKIMNQDGYSESININGVTIRGEFENAPEYSDLLIEFIGDSITHGCGLASPGYSSGENDGTLTYAFVASEELGADYTIMANGGMGVKWGGDYDTTDLNRSMAKYPYLNDTKRGTTAYTGYQRQADLVVIGLSTNDNYRFELQYKADREAYKAENPDYTWEEVDAHSKAFTEAKMAELGAELETLIAEIEKNHGKSVPIIFARGMMEKAADDATAELYHTSVTYMTKLIEETWGGKYGEHVIKVAHLTPDRTGYAAHPTREGAVIQGQDLAEFIRAEFPELVPAN